MRNAGAHRATLKGLRFFISDREDTTRVMAKYMSVPYESALRPYHTRIPVFVSDDMLSESFHDKVRDFELKAIGTDKKVQREEGL